MKEDSSFELESEESFHIAEIKSISASLKASIAKPEAPEEDLPPDLGSEESLDETVLMGETESVHPPDVPEVAARMEKRRAVSQIKLPLLAKETTNPNTFDLDYLMDPQKQKRARERLEGQTSKTPERAMRAEHTNRSTSGTSPDAQHADHLLSYKHVYEAKKKSREAAQEALDMQECTFRPHIKSSTQRPRSPEEFFQDMNRYQSRREERVTQMKEEIDQKNSADNYPFKPTLTSSSRRLACSRSQEEVFARLSSCKVKNLTRPLPPTPDLLSSLESQAAQPQFTPQINAKSKRLQREGNVSERLVEDAKRRAASSISPLTQRSASPELAPKSVEMLVNRFKTEVDKGLAGDQKVGYGRLKEIMVGLRMVGKDAKSGDLCAKLWTELSKETDEIPAEMLKNALLDVMNYGPAGPSRLHKDYYELYCNRMGRHTPRVSPSPAPSKSPLRDKAESVQYIDHLIASKTKVEQKVTELRETLEAKQMQNCSFAPAINKRIPKSSRSPNPPASSSTVSSEYRKLVEKERSRAKALNELATIQREKRALSPFLAVDTTDCTFAPVLTERLNPQPVKPAKGVADAVRRLAQARENAEWRSLMQAKGRPQSESLEKERRQWASRRSPKHM